MSFDGSEIEVIYDDDVDISNHCTVAAASFSSSANATPGTAELLLRDPDRELSFTTGKRLRLKIDGTSMWSGFVMIKGGSSFFPAGDGREDTSARSFILRGVDNNILLDKRILYNSSNFLKKIPNVTTNTMDGELLRTALASYSTGWGGIDISTYIDDVVVPAGQDITSTKPWAWPQQGSKIRALGDDLAAWSSAVYYIGPDDAWHYHALQTVECPWGFSDRPNHAAISGTGGPFEGAYWGFRELTADEDGTDFATDAFVWGGSPFAGSGSTVFHRATDGDLEDIHGKWQYAEAHFNETNYKLQAGVTQRANQIVFGNPTGDTSGSEPGTVVGEGPRGLRFPQWAYSFTWFTKDVPSFGGVPRHLYPGDIVPIQLWAFSQDGGTTPFTKLLPLRALRINFHAARNAKAHVQFNGSFDLRNEDSVFLWKYLRRREPRITTLSIAGVNDNSTDAPQGAFGQFTPVPVPDGSTSTFTVKFPYIPDTGQLYVDAGSGFVLKTRSSGYWNESNPDAGEFEIVTPPTAGWKLFFTCRTQQS